ncbi:hypothetical protein [Flaviflagellibacter deserti]|uniref:Uncharacterized protein n=1 Tax=Flaviflagellibacter deserti TaxID=2267266 RepID=A0ABV9Z1L8_9HYPH
MAGAAGLVRIGGAMLAVALLAAPAEAQFLFGSAPKGPPLTREQVRIRLLDGCVLTQSGKAADQGAGPKCNCYASRVAKAMTDADILAYSSTKKLTPTVQAEATKALAVCK